MKKVALHNLGCKVNAYEGEAIQQQFEKKGYSIVPFAPGADIYIINTCTVTNIADRKSRQMLHKAKKMNPESVVVAAGCYVQTAEDHGKMDEAIDLVIGNNRKKDIVSLVESYLYGEEQDAAPVIDINDTKEYEELNLEKTAEHTRAYIKVQDGCNQFCSYCIIPYARGRVRSRKKSDVIQEVTILAEAGYQEVVLTGIHLSSYGIDFAEREDLKSLIQAVHEVEGIRRIRLGSLEPRIITEDFCRILTSLPKICPHFHLSLQSGCEETLKEMNRRYSAREYSEKCSMLRKYFDNPAITTDIIVGFPGETDENFEESRAFTEKTGFCETHIFKYSKREGTKAAKRTDQIDEQVKQERSKILQDINRKSQKSYLESKLGETLEILLEETVEIREKLYWTGYTKEYIKAVLPADGQKANQLVKCAAETVLEKNILLCSQ